MRSKEVLKEKLNELYTNLQVAGTLVSQLPDMDYADYWYMCMGVLPEIKVTIPHYLPFFKEYRKLLGREWRRYHYSKDSSCYSYVHSETMLTLSIYLQTGVEGASCKRVKVGEETVTRDIYEVVCNDS